MADGMIDTATQRPATGLDRGARGLIIRVVADLADLGPEELVSALFYDRFGGLEDYYGGVRRVWGEGEAFQLEQVVSAAGAEAEFAFTIGRPRPEADFLRAHALLLAAPEPDFRLAIGEGLRAVKAMKAAAPRITAICRNRGVPWAFTEMGGFEYVGDEEIERRLIRPGLAAINRPEFSGGARQEFEAARAELAKGGPGDLKQAIVEAGAAVESAMKVVLEARGVPFDARDTSSPLFDHLKTAGIVPNHMKDLVLVAMVPRNKVAAHGGGPVAHNVFAAEAEAVVAGAAGAIAYLATHLP